MNDNFNNDYDPVKLAEKIKKARKKNGQAKTKTKGIPLTYKDDSDEEMLLSPPDIKKQAT